MRNSVACLALVVIWALGFSHAAGQIVRPIRDDIGYCWNLDQMKRLVDFLEAAEKDSALGENPIAGISPHDDYLYAAKVYYPLFRVLRAKEVVIFGVTHRAVRNEIGDPQNLLIMDEHASWQGLHQRLVISPLREFIKGRLDTSYVVVSNKAHQLEHSIEAVLPFLEYFNPGVRITPIMVTAMALERMEEVSGILAHVLAEYIRKEKMIPGKDVVFLISSDANHYGRDFNNIPFGEDETAHRTATGKDVQMCTAYLGGILTAGKIRELTSQLRDVVWCGRYSVPFGLLTVQKTMENLGNQRITGRIMRYSDSYSEGVIPLHGTGLGTTAPFSLKHWVGWFSAGFYLE